VDLADPSWNLLERVQNYRGTVEATLDFRQRIIPGVALRPMLDMINQNSDIGTSITIRSVRRKEDFSGEVLPEEIDNDGINNRGQYFTSVSFLESIIPSTEDNGQIFAIARTDFQRNFDLTITRISAANFLLEGTIKFGIDDRFIDAADFDDDIPGRQEFIGGTAYDIFAEWSEPYSRTFDLINEVNP